MNKILPAVLDYYLKCVFLICVHRIAYTASNSASTDLEESLSC